MSRILNRHKRSTIVDNFQPNDMEVIDENLQSMLKPLNMMQALILCAKYKIRDDVVTVNSIQYSVLSLIGLFIVAITCVYGASLDLSSETKADVTVFDILHYVVSNGLCFIGYLLNYYTNFKYRYDNALLLLKTQNANNILKFDSKKYIRINWAAVVAMNCFYIFWMFYYSILFLQFRWWDMMTSYFEILFDINVIYASRLLNLLTHYLIVWVKNVKSSGFLGEMDNENYWSKIFNAFLEVFDVYQLLEKTFHVLVSNNSI